MTEPPNPYWDAVREHAREGTRPWDDGLTVGQLFGVDRELRDIPDRSRFVSEYSWSITDPDTVAFVAAHSGGSIVDPMAGTGYWGSLLEQLGVDVACYDLNPGDSPWHRSAPLHMLVQKMDGAEAVRKHPDRTLLLSWPPYKEATGVRILAAYSGNRVIFIGEEGGGCTGDANLHAYLEKRWTRVARHRPVQWFGMHDQVIVYERN